MLLRPFRVPVAAGRTARDDQARIVRARAAIAVRVDMETVPARRQALEIGREHRTAAATADRHRADRLARAARVDPVHGGGEVGGPRSAGQDQHERDAEEPAAHSSPASWLGCRAERVGRLALTASKGTSVCPAH